MNDWQKRLDEYLLQSDDEAVWEMKVSPEMRRESIRWEIEELKTYISDFRRTHTMNAKNKKELGRLKGILNELKDELKKSEKEL